jgi:hypothetical protein
VEKEGRVAGGVEGKETEEVKRWKGRMKEEGRGRTEGPRKKQKSSITLVES